MSPTIMDTDPAATGEAQKNSRANSVPHLPDNSLSDSARPQNGLQEPAPIPSAPEPANLRRESVFSPIADIFIGPDGLYPVTRWLIYVVLAFVTLAILNTLLAELRPVPAPVWWTMVGELRLSLAAVLPAFFMARIEGCSFGDFGLPEKGAFRRNFWIGALWGIVALSVLMLTMRIIGVFSLGPLNVHGVRIYKFAFYYAVFFLITGIFEEFLVRGYSQWVLAQSMHFWPAAALLSILFGVMHLANPGEAKIGIAAVVVIGFFFCLTLRRTGTLWWAVGFHMSWDWGESYLYSVPDSGGVAPDRLLNSSFHGPDWLTGGSVGPEGSYLVFVVLIALWIIFDHVYPEVKYGGATSGGVPHVD